MDRDSTTSLGNLCWYLATLTENGLLCLSRISCISVCASCSLSCHWAPLKRVWLYLPHSIRCLLTLMRLYLSLLFSMLDSPNHFSLDLVGEMLQSLSHLCGPFLGFAPACSITSCVREPDTGPSTPDVSRWG